jgi:uncharacterized membrane protein (UPF0127 family)
MSAIAVPPNGSRVRVLNRTSNVVLAERTTVASRPWTRMRGLLGRTALRPGEGILISPCQGVHTFGMSYPIDVVHVDRRGVVCRVLREMHPWRLGPLLFRSHFVLELAAGTARVAEGDWLVLEPLAQ